MLQLRRKVHADSALVASRMRLCAPFFFTVSVLCCALLQLNLSLGEHYHTCKSSLRVCTCRLHYVGC
jgi:hypothetical protein